MSDFTPRVVNDIITEKEPDIHELCSPYSGNCYEIALALYRILHEESEGFWSVYATTEHIWTSDALPLHIVVQVHGNLFDAGGRLYQSQLLEEYAPEQNSDLLTFEETFEYEHVVNDDILTKVIETYEPALNER